MKNLTNETFIGKAKEIHGDKYNYSKVEYVNSSTKVCIICYKHREFLQKPNNHLNGQGCPLCGLNSRAQKRTYTKETFVNKAKVIHDDKYDYSNSIYKGSYEKTCIICKVHGKFWQTPHNHLKGQGCPQCALDNSPLLSTIEKFTEKARLIHGYKYDYTLSKYVGSKKKTDIICPIHGMFSQTPNDHLQGCGCPKCGKENSIVINSSNTDEFIEKAKQVFGDNYDYSKVLYNKSKEKVCVVCPTHGDFYTTPSNHLSGYGCPKCGNTISKVENEIFNICKSICNDTIQSDRTVIKPLELDIYTPSKHLAIEYDGLRWHSEQFKENAETYHLEKTNLCKDKGIRLIHVFEDEWIEKKEIVKSILNNILGNNMYRIFARKCTINEISIEEAKIFLKENSIEFNITEVKYNIGLFYKNELVLVMTFGEINDGTTVLQSYCNKLDTIVVGGASKLLQYFIRREKPNEISTVVDKRWSNGDLFKKLGFNMVKENEPSYYYVVDTHRENKAKYENYGDNSISNQVLNERGLYRIYDCGTMEFELKLNSMALLR